MERLFEEMQMACPAHTFPRQLPFVTVSLPADLYAHPEAELGLLAIGGDAKQLSAYLSGMSEEVRARSKTALTRAIETYLAENNVAALAVFRGSDLCAQNMFTRPFFSINSKTLDALHEFCKQIPKSQRPLNPNWLLERACCTGRVDLLRHLVERHNMSFNDAEDYIMRVSSTALMEQLVLYKTQNHPCMHGYDLLTKSVSLIENRHMFDYLLAYLPEYAKAVRDGTLARLAAARTTQVLFREIEDVFSRLLIHGLDVTADFLLYFAATALGPDAPGLSDYVSNVRASRMPACTQVYDTLLSRHKSRTTADLLVFRHILRTLIDNMHVCPRSGRVHAYGFHSTLQHLVRFSEEAAFDTIVGDLSLHATSHLPAHGFVLDLLRLLRAPVTPDVATRMLANLSEQSCVSLKNTLFEAGGVPSARDQHSKAAAHMVGEWKRWLASRLNSELALDRDCLGIVLAYL